MKNTCAALIIILTLITSTNLFAQRGKLSGRVFSASTKEVVTQATIRLLNKDSIPLRTMLTDSSGRFSFNDINPGSYMLQVNALSFSAFNQIVLLPQNNNKLHLDSVFIQPSYDALQGVTIVSRRASIAVKTDTTEFTAGAFKVRRNGTVEDVFKKMPGLEVDKNGSIKAQGESVTKIYVDGKPFFGTDFKSVTQNFPADVIDKIQIIDKRSDQALATNVEDGVREKIINITLKKNRKSGVFGKEYIGIGTAGRYEARGNTNFFNNERKISIIAGANNTGRNDNNGGDDASYDNWNGISDNKQLKLNYADKFGKNFDLSAWAGYDRSKTVKEQAINRQNIFTDSSTYYTENNNSNYVGNNYYAGVYFEYRPDTLTMVRFNQSAGYNNSRNNFNSVFNSTLPGDVKWNDGNRQTSNHSTIPNFNGQLSINHRFSGSRRNIFFNFYNDVNNNRNNKYNLSNNYFYPVDSTDYDIAINQFQNFYNRNTRLGSTVSYSEPLGDRSSLNLSYNYNYTKNDVPREIYDFNNQTQLYDIFNDSLSNHFNNNTYNNVASLSYNYNAKKSGFGVGVKWQNGLIKSLSFDKDSIYKQTFSGISPNLNFYSNGKNKRLNIYYNFNLQAPQANQLQPVVDNTNPLYLKLGNPDLKYAQVHTVRYNFNYYNPKRETGFNSNAGFSAVMDNIVNSNTFNSTTGAQVSKPVNMDGAYNWNAWFSYFRPLYLGKDKLKWNLNLFTNGGRNVSLLNGEENISNSNFARVFLGLTYDAPKWIDLHTDVSFSRQESEYSLQPTLNNTSYFFNVSPNITLTPETNTEINIDYDYRQTTGQSAGFNTSVNMLNADVVHYFTEKKSVWLKLKAYDLLKQNVSIWRSSGDNYIQDTRANVLSRFVLLSLNFRLNKFNTKTDNMDFIQPGSPAGQSKVDM